MLRNLVRAFKRCFKNFVGILPIFWLFPVVVVLRGIHKRDKVRTIKKEPAYDTPVLEIEDTKKVNPLILGQLPF